MNTLRLTLDAVTCERGNKRLFAPLHLTLEARSSQAAATQVISAPSAQASTPLQGIEGSQVGGSQGGSQERSPAPMGQWAHIQGMNGVGKTTLLRVVCGLSPPASGQVLWQGQPIAQMKSDYQSQLLYLGHALALKSELSALENLFMDARLRKTELTSSQALAALSELGLRARAHLPLGVLSQGQQRRAALARLVLSQAKLWVLDEPWVALDADSSALLTQRLDDHVRKGGLLLFTSHQVAPLTTPGIMVRLTP